MNAGIPHRLLTPALAGLALLSATTAWAAGAERREARQFDAGSGLIVELENLAGAVEIEGTSGTQVTIEAVIVADAASQAEADRLASEIEIVYQQRGSRLEIEARYPVERHTTYHYPGNGGGRGKTNTNTRYQGERVKVVSKAERGAVTLYADFKIGLPSGVGAEIELAAGDVTAREVRGRLDLDTGSGGVRISGGEGKVEADTGSGVVEVSDHHGEVNADTGSGAVRLERIVGDVRADTGSGKIVLEDVEGDEVLADTGSGDVELGRVRGELTIDTGSGSVSGEDLVAHGRLLADTGSGSVTLRGDFSALERIEIDTGSGAVTLEGLLPPMDLEITTGSGKIEVDAPGLEVIHREKDSFEGRTGGGGVAVTIDTGSGGVRIRETG